MNEEKILENKISETVELNEGKKYINIEDLMKVEIKVGKILNVEDVDGSEKLYKLSVDFGEGRSRQVLSGIRKFFPNKEDLLNRQFAFITNLVPRKMMGLESEAMILATGEESLALLSPTIETKNGSQMR
jgi:methionyl-tRNA synthetase